MPTLVCQRCSSRMVWGLLSAQAWLEHDNGDGQPRHVCPSCRAELSEDEQTTFVRTGAIDGHRPAP